MAKRNYYALVAGLPDIVPEEKRSLFSSVAFRQLLSEHLHPEDLRLAELFYLPFDHFNLLNLLFDRNMGWDERGNYSRESLELLKDRKSLENEDLSDFPTYLVDFASSFFSEDAPSDYYTAEMRLTLAYINYLEQSPNEFVRKYAAYQMNVGNVMAALNGRKHNIPFENALVGDNDIVAALKKSRARDFGLAAELPEIEQLIQIFEINDLLERELKLDYYKWEYLDEISFFDYFTIERVLVFLLKLFMAERWSALDFEKGKEMFNRLLKEFETGFQFPAEFTVAYGKK